MSQGTDFPWEKTELDVQLRVPVRKYWQARGGQSSEQSQRGRKDAGRRGEVTGGQHLNAFLKLITDVAGAAGFLVRKFD